MFVVSGIDLWSCVCVNTSTLETVSPHGPFLYTVYETGPPQGSYDSPSLFGGGEEMYDIEILFRLILWTKFFHILTSPFLLLSYQLNLTLQVPPEIPLYRKLHQNFLPFLKMNMCSRPLIIVSL